MKKRKKSSGYAVVLLCVTVLISTGIGEHYVTAQVTAPGSSQEQDPVNVKSNDMSFAIETVEYTAAGRRDPFASIISLARKKMSVEKKSTNPIENFDVTDFKLLGVIYDGKKYYASVVLPDNKAYTLTKGMKVGIHGGNIMDITSDKLVIREYITDFMGKKEPKYTEIKLRTEEVQ